MLRGLSWSPCFLPFVIDAAVGDEGARANASRIDPASVSSASARIAGPTRRLRNVLHARAHARGVRERERAGGRSRQCSLSSVARQRVRLGRALSGRLARRVRHGIPGGDLQVGRARERVRGRIRERGLPRSQRLQLEPARRSRARDAGMRRVDEPLLRARGGVWRVVATGGLPDDPARGRRLLALGRLHVGVRELPRQHRRHALRCVQAAACL